MVVVAVGYTLLALCAVGAGLLLTDIVLPGAVQRWDSERRAHARRPAYPRSTPATLVGSYLSEFATVLVLGGLIVAISIWRRWFRLAVLFTIAICLEGAVYVTTTYFVTRTRPHIPRLEQLIVSDSFPSGHVAAAVVLWFALGLLVWNITHNRWLRGLTVVVVAVAPVIVARCRGCTAGCTTRPMRSSATRSAGRASGSRSSRYEPSGQRPTVGASNRRRA